MTFQRHKCSRDIDEFTKLQSSGEKIQVLHKEILEKVREEI